jgi:hypothetical protein
MIGNLPLPDISLVIIIKLKIGRNIIYVHEFISKLEFLIHEIFVEVEGHAFKQMVSTYANVTMRTHQMRRTSLGQSTFSKGQYV